MSVALAKNFAARLGTVVAVAFADAPLVLMGAELEPAEEPEEKMTTKPLGPDVYKYGKVPGAWGKLTMQVHRLTAKLEEEEKRHKEAHGNVLKKLGEAEEVIKSKGRRLSSLHSLHAKQGEKLSAQEKKCLDKGALVEKMLGEKKTTHDKGVKAYRKMAGEQKEVQEKCAALEKRVQNLLTATKDSQNQAERKELGSEAQRKELEALLSEVQATCAGLRVEKEEAQQEVVGMKRDEEDRMAAKVLKAASKKAAREAADQAVFDEWMAVEDPVGGDFVFVG